MPALVIGPTSATLRRLAGLDRATDRLNADMSRALTGAMAGQRNDLVSRWKTQLSTVHPATDRGVRWEAARGGRNARARLYITRRVWRYMELQIEGGRRTYPRGFVVYFPGVSRSERRRFNDPDRYEIPLRNSPNRLVLQGRPGRSRALGVRIFRADYRPRAAGEKYINARLPRSIGLKVNDAYAMHAVRAGQ